MSDDRINLTRRKILAGLGAVGAAGAGAGLGTSALYSDEETFKQNTLAAGSLDLRMDWEEHYSYPQIYGLGDPTNGGELDVRRETPEDTSDYVGLPDPKDPVVWVHEEDFEQYFQNTTIEAFPDADDSPIEADFQATNPCELLADVPGDLGTYNTEVDGPGRTKNGDTFEEGKGPLPLISLTDVKPGDYGEFTFSAHLCHNDGYLWLQMPDGLTEKENDVVEPETGDESPEEGELAENMQTALWYDDGCSNTIDGEPEPLVAMALIDTSNSIDAAEMQQIAAASNAFVELLNSVRQTEVAAGVMTFSGEDPNPGGGGPSIVLQNDVEKLQTGSAYLDSDGDGKFAAGENLLPSEGSGSTPLAPALDLAREVLNDRAETLIAESGNGFGPNTRKTILVISDGLPTTPAFERYGLVDPAGNDVVAQNTGVTNADDGQFLSDVFDGTPDGSTDSTSIRDEAALVARDIDTGPRTDNEFPPDVGDISGTDDITLRTVGLGTAARGDLDDFLTRIASDPGLFYNTTIGDLGDLVGDLVNDLNVTGPAEEVIFRGTLAELATELDPEQDGPLPLDGMPMGSDFDELNDPADDPDRQPFNADATQCFGLAWWVPRDVGNEIQSDSVSFDLGFYAEQARNNDGTY